MAGIERIRRLVRWSALLAVGVVLFSPSLGAQMLIQLPVEDENLPGRCDSQVFGEALFWAPNATDFNYAEIGNIDPAGLYQFDAVAEDLIAEVLDPGYDWGFRAGFRMNRDRWFTRMEFLWVEVENKATSRRGPNDNTMSIPELGLDAGHATGFRTAFADSNTQYQNVSLQVGITGRNIARGWYETYGAAEMVYYRFRLRVRAEGEVILDPAPNPLPIKGRYSKEVEMVGLGVGSGFRALAHLGCGFSMGGSIEAVATVSRVKVFFHSDALAPALSFDPPPDNIYEDTRLPTTESLQPCFALGFKGRVNVQYTRCFSVYKLNGQLGFEANVYKIGFIGGPLISLGINF